MLQAYGALLVPHRPANFLLVSPPQPAHGPPSLTIGFILS